MAAIDLFIFGTSILNGNYMTKEYTLAMATGVSNYRALLAPSYKKKTELEKKKGRLALPLISCSDLRLAFCSAQSY